MPASAPVAGLAPTCAIVALSEDPLLLEAVAGTAIDGASVSIAPSTDRFIDQLVANGAGIALIDGGSVTTPLKNFLSTLREQFPQLLLIEGGRVQRAIALEGHAVAVGREGDNDVALESPRVSRYHLRFVRTGERWRLKILRITTGSSLRCTKRSG